MPDRKVHLPSIQTATYSNLLPDFHRPRDALESVALLYLAAQLLRYHNHRRQRVSNEEYKEEQTQHGNLPWRVGMARQLIQLVTVVGLKDVAAEERRQ